MKKGDKMRNLPIAEPPNCGCFPPCRFGGRQRTDDLLQEYVRKITASWQTNFAFATKTIACLASYGDLPRGIEEGADHLAGGTLTQADQRLVHQHLAVGEANRHEARVLAEFSRRDHPRSEEHTSELQSLMRNSYAVLCLKKKKQLKHKHTYT